MGLNFAQHKDRVFYFFNEFGYWSALREQYGNDLDSAGVYAGQDDQVQAKVASKYPGEGVYIIAISAEPGFVSRVGKNVPCQAGQIKVAAILFYDNGEGFQPLSASCIALNPTDAFNLYISSNNSGAVKLPHGVTAFSGRLTNSPSGSVNFQASEITVTIPKQSTQKLSVKSSKKGSVSSTRSEQASSSTSSSLSNDIVPTISLGNPLNLGASPQSISLRKS